MDHNKSPIHYYPVLFTILPLERNALILDSLLTASRQDYFSRASRFVRGRYRQDSLPRGGWEASGQVRAWVRCVRLRTLPSKKDPVA